MASATENTQIPVNGDDASKIPTEQSHFTQTAGAASSEPDIASLNLQPATLALHADDPLNAYLTDVSPPIHVSTTFRYPRDPSQLTPFDERLAQGRSFREKTENIYSRDSTASGTRFETILSSLLKGHVLTYSSGLATLNAILTHLTPKRIAIGAGYHGSHGVLEIYSRLTGAKVLPLDCPATDLNEGDLIWLETPVNPHGTAFDIQSFADKAHSRGAYLGVDSTFAPPPIQNPFLHGADIIMHSATKYLGGHSDLLAGVVAIKPDARGSQWLQAMTMDRLHLGTIPGSMESWLGVRSIRTLELRVRKQSESTTFIVDALDGALTNQTVGTGLSQSDAQTVQKTISKINHASLQLHDHESNAATWLRKQMPNGYGAVFSIETKNEEIAKRLPSKLNLFHHATSLGGVESLIEWRRMTDETVARNVLRVSIGVEDERDLLDDLLQGFRLLIDELKL